MSTRDYLTTPGQTVPSFHFRVGKPPVLTRDGGPDSADRAPANENGYPQPGVQSPTPHEATAYHYFVDETTWRNIIDHGEFDDVVVGSGFCALAYVTEALKLDPFRKILVLERGGMKCIY